MEQTTPANAPETPEAATPEQRPGLVLDNIVARMMQTRRDIDAYDRGEITQTELEALGIKLF